MTCIKELKHQIFNQQNHDTALQIIDLLNGFLSRVESGEIVKRPLYAVNERVRAYWKKRPNKYNATIIAINPDGNSYQVRYDDNDFDDNCPEINLFTMLDQRKELKINDIGDIHLYPRNLLSNDEQYFNLFYELLAYGGKLSTGVWNLLSNLSLNENIKNKISNLIDKEVIDWSSILPADSINKFYYTLQIVELNISMIDHDHQDNEQQVDIPQAPHLIHQTPVSDNEDHEQLIKQQQHNDTNHHIQPQNISPSHHHHHHH